jgi:hypothetical protein
MFLMLLSGIVVGFFLAVAIIAILLEIGKINTVLNFLMVKKRYAEVIPAKPLTPNPDLYFKQPPDKKTPNK